MFTDIEGSTRKWEKYPDQMKLYISKHDTILMSSIKKHGGEIIKHTGDGVFAAFGDGDPLQASIDIQLGLSHEDWGDVGEMRVRIGLHAGHADQLGNDYFGPVVNRTARVMGTAWGGQIIITPDVKMCTRMPQGAILKDMGMHLLKDLGDPQQLFQLSHPDMAVREFPPLHSLSAHRHNLPLQTTPFLGRENELTEIIRLLKDNKCRLLTLVGPGGIGKTRLALQAAVERIERFTHGVFFIPLDPLSSADYLVTAIAEILKFKFYRQEDEQQQLLNFLLDKELLLIMDNFEHLVEGANIIGDILHHAPNVKILVTSRELLNLQGEWIVQLQGLNVPAGRSIDIEGYSAVQLFLYNAQRVQGKVVLSDEERNYVARICQLVGGLPLGIEIASSWLRSLTCKEIAQEIEKNFDFLSTTMRDIPDRHRSLRAVFEYSWKLISPDEQEVLKRISVFRGGFTRKAAEHVANASVAVLGSLTDKSLLYRDKEGRYRIFEILRQYAEEKLTENERQTVYEKHNGYYMNYLYHYQDSVKEDLEPEIYNSIRSELENIRTAYDRVTAQGDPELLDKAPVTLYYFYSHYGWLNDGQIEMKKAVDVLQGKEDARSRLVYQKYVQRYAMFRYNLGFYEEALKYLQPCADFFQSIDDTSELAQVLMSIGTIEVYMSEYDRAVEHYQQAFEIFKTRDDQKNMAGMLNNIGVIHWYRREYEKAREMFKQCLQIGNELEHRSSRSLALGNLGIIAQELGDYDEALERLNECLKLEQTGGDKLKIANTLNNLGVLYVKMKRYEEAQKVYLEALQMRQDSGDRMAISNSLYNSGQLSMRLKKYDEARSYMQRSYEISKGIGDRRGMAERIGRMAEVALSGGRIDEAKHYLYDALHAGLDAHHEVVITEAMVGIMEILHSEGKGKEAYEISLFVAPDDIYNEDIHKKFDAMKKMLKKSMPESSRHEVEKRSKNRKLEPFIGSFLKKDVMKKFKEQDKGDL